MDKEEKLCARTREYRSDSCTIIGRLTASILTIRRVIDHVEIETPVSYLSIILPCIFSSDRRTCAFQRTAISDKKSLNKMCPKTEFYFADEIWTTNLINDK